MTKKLTWRWNDEEDCFCGFYDGERVATLRPDMWGIFEVRMEAEPSFFFKGDYTDSMKGCKRYVKKILRQAASGHSMQPCAL
jgi:hypothetical protein